MTWTYINLADFGTKDIFRCTIYTSDNPFFRYVWYTAIKLQTHLFDLATYWTKPFNCVGFRGILPSQPHFIFWIANLNLKCMFPNVFLIAYFVTLSYPNVYFFFLCGSDWPYCYQNLQHKFQCLHRIETQILFEIQGFYFFSNIISKRDVNPR